MGGMIREKPTIPGTEKLEDARRGCDPAHHRARPMCLTPLPQGWDDDVCLIRFHAGPPYEDIAFKVVNKKWEYSSRRCPPPSSDANGADPRATAPLPWGLGWGAVLPRKHPSPAHTDTVMASGVALRSSVPAATHALILATTRIPPRCRMPPRGAAGGTAARSSAGCCTSTSTSSTTATAGNPTGRIPSPPLSVPRTVPLSPTNCPFATPRPVAPGHLPLPLCIPQQEAPLAHRLSCHAPSPQRGSVAVAVSVSCACTCFSHSRPAGKEFHEDGTKSSFSFSVT